MPSTNVKNGLYWSDSTKTWHYEFRLANKKRNGDTDHPVRSMAVEFLADLKRELRRDQAGLPPKPKADATLDAVLQAWELAEAGTLTEKHILDRAYFMRRHLADFLNLPVDKLTTARLDEARAAYLAGTWTNDTWTTCKGHQHTQGGWNHIRRHLVGLVNWGISRGMVRAMPFTGKPIKTQQAVRSIIWPEEVADFLEDVRIYTTSHDLRTAIRLMVQLGLREDEALNAKWEYVLARIQTYRVGETKNRKTRDVPMPDGLVEYLRATHGQATVGLILAWEDEKGVRHPHEERFTAKALARVARVRQLPSLSPHSLRATFATAHWEAGTELAKLTAMLGHEDPNTTMGYIVHRPRSAAEAQKKVAETMGMLPSSPPIVPKTRPRKKRKKVKSTLSKKAQSPS